MAKLRRFSLVVAVATAVALVAVPADPVSALVPGVVSASVRDAVDDAGAEEVAPEGPSEDVPSELTAELVERLVPDSTAARLPRAEVPVGDYSALLAEAESVVVPEVFESVASERSGEELAAEVAGLEVVERSEYENVFARGDGSFIRQSSSTPLNVKVGGVWREVSTAVAGKGEGFAVDAHPLAPVFPADAREPLVVSRGGHEVSMQLVDGGSARGEVVAAEQASAVVPSMSVLSPDATRGPGGSGRNVAGASG